jgi:uncharacterized protein
MARDGARSAAIRVRVQPRARRDEVAGERRGAVVIRVSAPPVEGKANDRLRRVIAKQVGVAKGAVEIVRGARGREKLVRVAGIDPEGLRAALLSGSEAGSDGA